LLMSAATQINPISEGATARSDNAAELVEFRGNHSANLGLADVGCQRPYILRRSMIHAVPVLVITC
jgi:hypothetical protein